MRWEDERYVRVYTRDTADWLSLSFEAQSLLMHLFRKVDRAGVLKLGRHGKRAVAIAIGHAGAWDRLEPALDELLSDGCVRIEGESLCVRNFMDAQETPQSDALRKRESRARARDSALTPPPVTFRDQMSRTVTPGHAASHAVTPSRAVPDRAEPPVPNTSDACASGGEQVSMLSAFGAIAVPAIAAGAQREKRQKPRAVDEPPVAPGYQELTDALFVAFKASRGHVPKPRPKDWVALKRLRLRIGDDAELQRRWLIGLAGQFKQRCDSFWDLDERWDSLTATGPPTRAGGARFVNAQDMDHSNAKVGVVNDW